MLPLNDLGSDSPLYFSLLEHACKNALKRINGTVVTSGLLFGAQSRLPQKNDRPRASHETGTCTTPSRECCSAECSPLASESPREWMQIRQSVRQFELHPDRDLANRTAHRHANLRGNTGLDSLELTASLLSPKSAPYAGRWGPPAVYIATPLDGSLQFSVRRFKCELDGRSALRFCRYVACLFVESRASQITSKGGHHVSKQRSSKF